jgi:hypothetical protein
MTHVEIARQIRLLIAEEQYEEALQLLPVYAQAVTEECLADEDFRRARDFLKAACKSVKARRAHYIAQLGELTANRAYSGPAPSGGGSVDITG